MSIRTNPMKAVPLVLKHLVKAEKRADLDLGDLKSELDKIKDLFSIVKKNEDELLDTLTVLYNYLRSLNTNTDKLKEEKEAICDSIRRSAQKLLPADDANQTTNTEAPKSSQNGKLDTTQRVKAALSFNPEPDNLEILMKVNYKPLFSSLLHFPENAVMKRRHFLLWWNMVKGGSNLDAGRKEFDIFLHERLIVPHGNGKFPVANKFKFNPVLRSLVENDSSQSDCLPLEQRKVELNDKSDHWKTISNFSARYLNFGPQWLAKMKNLEILQLGRWLHDSPKHHIEVQSQEFLKDLKEQKNLWYLSLRGISQISELPPSIVKLESLRVLDLKACHNLETLPGDISSLRNLTHLDLSHCYLLDRMPSGIDKLTKLQVLKGFVIDSSTPCKISDLAKLRKLERLSIHIGSGAVRKDRGAESLKELSKDMEFESLKELSKLEHLKISWGVSDTSYGDIKVMLPSKLKKLHLEGFPGTKIPDWLKPSKTKEYLKELNITGGKLKSMDHGENHNEWSVEIVRLKYLKDLNVDMTKLQELFPRLEYVEIVT